MKGRLATWALRLRGWRLAGEVPPLCKYVVVLAPHTCNWDFPLAMLAASGYGIRLSWLGKNTIFRWPVAGFLRGMGGIPVRRQHHDGMVGQVVDAFAARDTLVVGMTPEGTRTATSHWRSGFYHMARGAGVPIVLASLTGRHVDHPGPGGDAHRGCGEGHGGGEGLLCRQAGHPSLERPVPSGWSRRGAQRRSEGRGRRGQRAGGAGQPKCGSRSRKPGTAAPPNTCSTTCKHCCSSRGVTRWIEPSTSPGATAWRACSKRCVLSRRG